MKDGWTYRKLRDVVSFVNDGDWIESRHQSENGIRLIQTGNIGDGVFKAKDDKPHYISEETFSLLGCTEVIEGDCLVSRLPEPVGRACIVPNIGGKMITAVDCTILRFKPSMLPSFFVYYSRSKQYHREIANNTTGTTRKRISRKNLESVNVPLPPLAVQERIVAELDLLTGIIDKQKVQLKEYDTLARSIFYDMFGDPEDNNKGWEVAEMGDLFEIGSSKRVFESQWTDSGVPFYRAREIVRMSKNEPIESPIFISEELFQQYSQKFGVPSEGDIMVTAVGTLGVSYIVKAGDRFYFKDGNILWFSSRGICESRFIKDQYSTDYVIKQIQGNANAAVVGTYTIMNAKKTKVIVPPIALQKEYVDKVREIDNQKEKINKAIKETQTLFDYTMDKYFG